jgi:hypothetical protein
MPMPSNARQPTAPPPPPGPGRIQIDWNDLNTRRVDQRLREQAALERNRQQAAMDPLAYASNATADADAPARRRPLEHPAIALALFGLLGGLLAWGAGEGVKRAQPDLRAEAAAHMEVVSDYRHRQAAGQMTAVEADRGVASLREAYGDNPYFLVDSDATLTHEQAQNRLADVDRQQWPRRFLVNLLGFGLSGMLIAAALAAAEPLLAGNRTGALINGTVGAAAGLAGGVVVSLFVERLYNAVAAAANGHGLGGKTVGGVDLSRALAHAVSWGVLGLFLAVGPGLVMRNGKKLLIGLLGGLLGGLVGGAAFDPILVASDAVVSRAVALVLIGVVTGAFTGLIEHAARTGWVKVTAGLIAGKQFILYRNPTFIGSGPECPIYLFKDPAVGRRHAAVHAVPGGFELENLPLGGASMVNGRPVAARARLRNGDEIQIGSTRLRFQEKERT